MAKITYIAPEGDNPVVTIGGVRFFDGQPTEVDGVEHEQLIAKLRNNRHFEVTGDNKPAHDEKGLKAEHNGGGRFIITRGEELVLKGLTKADADAFNALSDEDKAAYVSKPAE